MMVTSWVRPEMLAELAISRYLAGPLNRNVGRPFREFNWRVGARVESVAIASFPKPDWSAHLVTTPLPLVVTLASALSQSWRPAETGRVCAWDLGYCTVKRSFCASVGTESMCEPPLVKTERRA